MRTTRFAPFVLAAATACGHGGISDKVKDSDYARLDPSQTAQVQPAREELAQAQDELTRAKMRLAAATTRSEYAEKLIAARKADVEAAERRIELASTKVELAKLQSLEVARAPAIGQYDQSVFYDRVAKAQRKLDSARSSARKLDDEATAAQRKADELAGKIPAPDR